ncbi:hypothetical protein V6N11_017834 [Hibiscus sabdariffa]|uniref:Uncharacterized protein n=2 Tax=Hibiscus sabdariffa TaxID=183260 RepID=A0ABR2T5L5_9ROSI
MEGIQSSALDQPTPSPSYKDSLLRNQPMSHILEDEIPDDDDVELIEGDAIRSTVDGIISIDFSDRVQAMAVKSLGRTVVIKLLGRQIRYNTFHAWLYDLWKPSQPFRLMDIENDYFLASFRTHYDYLNAISSGPWDICPTISNPMEQPQSSVTNVANLVVASIVQNLESTIDVT